MKMLATFLSDGLLFYSVRNLFYTLRRQSILALELTFHKDQIHDCNNIFSLALQPPRPWPLIFQFHDHFTVGRTPWTTDQLVAKPLPKHRTTKTQNKHIHKHPCLMGDSNRRSRLLSEGRQYVS
jgi:hypothetical protein